ncbi:MAG: peptidase C1, partial [Deltaproteobacteria bacterium]|nr:peptidase C1 [Deltaproteobacteria bacterium]
LGAPPASFDFEGKTVTPTAFVKEVLKIEPDHYVSVMSTLAVPFHSRAPFDVPDNWWKDASYHNVPLDEFYGALKATLQAGFSLTVALDTSEPGKDPLGEVMFVPDYDIPPHRINQLAREYRFAHRITTDDHGVHLVGLAEHDGHDWFLAKDSGRSSRRGKHAGYYFIRDDYVRLKVLTFTVHRDAVKSLLAKFGPEPVDGGLPGASGSR